MREDKKEKHMCFRGTLLAIALLGIGTSVGCTDSSGIDEEPCLGDEQCLEEMCSELVRCQIFFTSQGYCEFSFNSCLEDFTEEERSGWYREIRECLSLSDCLDIEGCYWRIPYC